MMGGGLTAGWRAPRGILYASPRIWDLHGVRPRTWSTRTPPVLARTHPDDRARLRESITESCSDDDARSAARQYRVLHPISRGALARGLQRSVPLSRRRQRLVLGMPTRSPIASGRRRPPSSERRAAAGFHLRGCANIGTGDMDSRARRVDLSNPMRRVFGLLSRHLQHHLRRVRGAGPSRRSAKASSPGSRELDSRPTYDLPRLPNRVAGWEHPLVTS